MSNNRPGTKGYLKEHPDPNKRAFFVGAKDATDPEAIYEGPVAEITWDDTWLHIVTDNYEGYAMLNIEALGPLRKALAKIARSIKARSADQ